MIIVTMKFILMIIMSFDNTEDEREVVMILMTFRIMVMVLIMMMKLMAIYKMMIMYLNLMMMTIMVMNIINVKTKIEIRTMMTTMFVVKNSSRLLTC